MRNNKIKAVVVGGWLNDKGESQMIQLIGAYESTTEAYGQAYLYLDELCKEEQHITHLHELDGDTGYAMYTEDKDEKLHDYAYILLNSESEQENQNETEE